VGFGVLVMGLGAPAVGFGVLVAGLRVPAAGSGVPALRFGVPAAVFGGFPDGGGPAGRQAQLSEDLYRAHFNLGHVRLREGDPSGALRCLARARDCARRLREKAMESECCGSTAQVGDAVEGGGHPPPSR